jgi:excisionase family DNA binding protein
LTNDYQFTKIDKKLFYLIISLMKDLKRDVLSLAQVASFLGSSRMTIYKFMKDEGLPNHTAGGKRLFLRDEVVAWIRSKESAPIRPRRKKSTPAPLTKPEETEKDQTRPSDSQNCEPT